MKKTMLLLLKSMGMFALSRFVTRRGVRILGYHGVWLGDESYPGDSMFMTQDTFETRLALMKRWRFPVITLDKAVAGLKGETLPPCPVVITIDDGWYSTYAAMWPALHRLGMPATLYCDTAHLFSCLPVPHVMARYSKLLSDAGYTGINGTDKSRDDALFSEAILDHGETGGRLEVVQRYCRSVSVNFDNYADKKVFDYMRPEQLLASYEEGLDVQLHTHNHTMGDMTEKTLSYEISENRRRLSALLGEVPEKFMHFCYPSGVCSSTLSNALDRLGVLSSTTTNRAIAYPHSERHLLPRILDGEQVSPLEFEAELCGVMDVLRKLKNFGR